MNLPIPMLADLETAPMLAPAKMIGRSGLQQAMIIFGALTAVVVLAFFFIILFRRRILRRRKRRHHHRAPEEIASGPEGDESPDENEGKTRRKWRRQRRPHRPLNPTLAQTRGLPPIRDEPPPGP